MGVRVETNQPFLHLQKSSYRSFRPSLRVGNESIFPFRSSLSFAVKWRILCSPFEGLDSDTAQSAVNHSNNSFWICNKCACFFQLLHHWPSGGLHLCSRPWLAFGVSGRFLRGRFGCPTQVVSLLEQGQKSCHNNSLSSWQSQHVHRWGRNFEWVHFMATWSNLSLLQIVAPGRAQAI